jgi:hypothetical protein
MRDGCTLAPFGYIRYRKEFLFVEKRNTRPVIEVGVNPPSLGKSEPEASGASAQPWVFLLFAIFQPHSSNPEGTIPAT